MEMKERIGMIDKIVIEHRRNGVLLSKHECNSGLLHKILVKLGLAHNSMTATSFGDITAWITGLSNPTAYTFICIGEGTTGDDVDDTEMESLVLAKQVTPTRSTGAKTNDKITWTHVFSHANDAGLTGEDAINEIGITSAATSYHLLLHVAGSTNYGAVDNCRWDVGSDVDTLTVTITCQIMQGS